jgi:hypothetical protein
MLLEGFRRRGGHVSATACCFRCVTELRARMHTKKWRSTWQVGYLSEVMFPSCKMILNGIFRHHQDYSSAYPTNKLPTKFQQSYKQTINISLPPQCPAHSASSAATRPLQHSLRLATTLATTPTRASTSDGAATTKVKALSCSAAAIATNGYSTTCHSWTWLRASLVEGRTLLELSCHPQDDDDDQSK